MPASYLGSPYAQLAIWEVLGREGVMLMKLMLMILKKTVVADVDDACDVDEVDLDYVEDVCGVDMI